MYRIFGDAEVMRFGDGVRTKARINTWLRTCLEHYHSWGFGPYAVVEQRSQDVIGYCGLHFFRTWPGSQKLRLAIDLRAQAGGRVTPLNLPARCATLH